jgi:hypothetical protein
MAKEQEQDIELGITRLQYGEQDRPQRAVLNICTRKHYNGGISSIAMVVWIGHHTRSHAFGLASGGDYECRLGRSAQTVKATQKAIDAQHAAIFTPDLIERLVEGAKAHYAQFVSSGIDGYKNRYFAEVAR